MAQLAARGFHASCTFGNAPCVDILVSAKDGHKSISIQVKTAKYAERWKKDKLVQLQSALGHKAVRQGNPGLIYAFVDLKGFSSLPDVYFVPSEWLKNEYGGEWVNTCKWVRFHVAPQSVERFKNRWESISELLK